MILDTLLIFLAQYYLAIPLLVAGIYFFFQPSSKKKDIFVLAVVSLPLIYIAAKIGAHLYFDPRPFTLSHIAPLIPHDPDNGFPSDHALLLSAVAMVFSFFSRKLGAFLWISLLLVGFARVAAGIHHPIDIIGSIVISVVISGLVYYGFRKAHLLPYGKTT